MKELSLLLSYRSMKCCISHLYFTMQIRLRRRQSIIHILTLLFLPLIPLFIYSIFFFSETEKKGPARLFKSLGENYGEKRIFLFEVDQANI